MDDIARPLVSEMQQQCRLYDLIECSEQDEDLSGAPIFGPIKKYIS